MSDTFDLHIDLGNDAMRSQADVADVIQRLARTIKIGSGEGTIRDLNGNTVGHYGFNLGVLLLVALERGLERRGVREALAQLQLDRARLPERGIVREKTDLEHAFDAASYKAAQAVVNNQPAAAREFADAAAAIAAAIHGPQIDKLELHDGDTLIVHLDAPIDTAYHERLQADIAERVDADVRVLVFAAGSRLAGVAFGRSGRHERIVTPAEDAATS